MAGTRQTGTALACKGTTYHRSRSTTVAVRSYCSTKGTGHLAGERGKGSQMGPERWQMLPCHPRKTSLIVTQSLSYSPPLTSHSPLERAPSTVLRRSLQLSASFRTVRVIRKAVLHYSAFPIRHLVKPLTGLSQWQVGTRCKGTPVVFPRKSQGQDVIIPSSLAAHPGRPTPAHVGGTGVTKGNACLSV